jgi:arylsulfatase A-like enzyme
MRSALTLEDLSRTIVAALDRSGELDETYLLFTSDNGFQLGLHGVRASKSTPYIEAHEVPLVVRGPGVPPGASPDALAANIDVAPTVLDLAGAGGLENGLAMDGRSLVPFLDGTPPASEGWRDALLIEGARSGSPRRPAYSGVYREDETYVEYENGEREYYDLAEDPHQLNNAPEEASPELRRRLAALRRCVGDGCRAADGDP